MDVSKVFWDEWRARIDQVVEDHGIWIGLADGRGVPRVEVPVTDLDAGATDLTADDVKISVPVDGEDHPLVGELIGDNAGLLDPVSGRLKASTDRADLVVVQGPGGWRNRLAFTVSMPSLEEDEHGPNALTIEGTALKELLNWWPGMSAPATWGDDSWASRQADGSYFVTQEVDESGTRYEKPRRISPTQSAMEARGHTDKGPVLTIIRNFIQNSLDAGNRLAGWNDPHLVVEFPDEKDDSPTALIFRENRSVWETIAEPARMYGLAVDVTLWWPGDPPVRTREGQWDKHPIGVVAVEKVGEW